MAVWIKRPDPSGAVCDCLPNPTDVCEEAACSLWEEDDTDFGPYTLTTDFEPTAHAALASDLAPGFYIPQYVEDTFRLEHVPLDTSFCTPPNPLDPPMSFVCLFAGSHSCLSVLGLTGLSFGYLPLGSAHYTTEADAETDYLTKNGSMPTIYIGDSANLEDIAFQSEEDTCGYVVNSGSAPFTAGPKFNLKRIKKLRVPQPETLTVTDLATFADSRFTITKTQTTMQLALNASAATVETALNALASITADGGVVCGGTLAAGLTVTWNVNGARSLLSPKIVTVSPGWTCDVQRTQAGDSGQPEIQTILITPIVALFTLAMVEPAFDGETVKRSLAFENWTTGIGTFVYPPKDCSGIRMVSMSVQHYCGPDRPTNAPAAANGGAGNVEAGTHQWAVTFVDTTTGLPPHESGLGPATSLLVVGASSIDLTGIPIGPAGTVGRKVYRTRLGKSDFCLVGTIANNTATTFTDTRADAALTVPAPAASRWWKLSFNADGGFGFPREMWAGAKTSGSDPTGTYHVYPLEDEDVAGTIYGHQRQVQQSSLTGTF